MARTTHVKKAQQRYRMVPVIDPATGEPKKTPVMRGDGTQKTTKKGRLVFLTITKQDKAQPLPPDTCDACGKEIEVGTPYKWIAPKSGPYGGRKRTRHESCPSWNVWDYSNSLSAQLARISHDFWEEIEGVASTDDVTSALESAAESIKEIATLKAEGADNIESGFGHETTASEELRQVGEDLDNWAEEITQADVPDIDDCVECDGDGSVDCEFCEGTGKDETGECPECSGSGSMTCEDCTEGQDIEGWREGLQDSLSIVDESPV